MQEKQQRILAAIGAHEGVYQSNTLRDHPGIRHAQGILLVSQETDAVYLQTRDGYVHRSIAVELHTNHPTTGTEFAVLAEVLPGGSFAPAREIDSAVIALNALGKAELYSYNYEQYRDSEGRMERFQNLIAAVGGIWLKEITPSTFGMMRERFITDFAVYWNGMSIALLLQGFFDDQGQTGSFFTSTSLVDRESRAFAVINHTGGGATNIHAVTNPEMLDHPDIDDRVLKDQVKNGKIYFFNGATRQWTIKEIPA